MRPLAQLSSSICLDSIRLLKTDRTSEDRLRDKRRSSHATSCFPSKFGLLGRLGLILASLAFRGKTIEMRRRRRRRRENNKNEEEEEEKQ